MKPCTHPWGGTRLTHNRSFLPATHKEKSADGLRGGLAHNCIQHSLAKLANDVLALMSELGWQNMTDLLQQLDHSILQKS